MTLFPLTSLAIVLALIVYFALGYVVGQARGTWNVTAPATSGHIEFDKRYRVHMNTLEQLVLFIPAAMLAAPVLGDPVTAGLGLVWSLARIAFARAYYVDPAKRGPGFTVALLVTAVLAVAAIVGAVRVLIG